MSKLIRRAALEKKSQEINEDTDALISHARAAERNPHKSQKKAGKEGTEQKIKTVAKKATGLKEKEEESRIIYLGHIPDGFFEGEMRKFFSQFGLVKRLKLFRSKKTNASKGYAFIEFQTADVATTVSDAMNGYYLLERQLVSNVVAPSMIHNGMFKAPQKRDASEISGVDDKDEDDNDMDDSEEVSEGNIKVWRSSLRNKQKKLKALGIDFDFVIP